MAGGNLFRTLRILILLFVLAMVALGSWLSKVRTTDWLEPLWVAIYPINGDASDASRDYIAELSEQTFQPVERFLKREAVAYRVSIEEPVSMKLRGEIDALPPEPPYGANILAVMYWSLKLRWWAGRAVRDDHELPGDIKLFVVYYDPDVHHQLGHSLGLQEGLIGVVNAFATPSMAAENNVVIAHELLHTLGATDKYDPETTLPRHPDGFAEPDRTPLYPQTKAEIMGGRIPVSAESAETPRGLKHAMVGQRTAREINWIN